MIPQVGTDHSVTAMLVLVCGIYSFYKGGGVMAVCVCPLSLLCLLPGETTNCQSSWVQPFKAHCCLQQREEFEALLPLLRCFCYLC